MKSRLMKLWGDTKGSAAFLELVLALVVMIPFLFMMLDVFGGLEQFHLARTLKNQYMSVIKVSGQLPSDQLTKLEKDANDMGFQLKSIAVQKSDGTLVGVQPENAVVRDTLQFDRCQLTVTLILKPAHPPFAAGRLFGKAVSGEYVLTMKGVTWSELGKRQK